jgi:hypothetical protein
LFTKVAHCQNPAANALINAAFNTDYLGRFIYNPEDPALKQVIDVTGQLIQDFFLPMSAPAYAKLGKHVMEGSGDISGHQRSGC